jgi:hypothetical protein
VPAQNADVIFAIPQSGRVKNGCVGPLAKDQVKAFKKGMLYANVHSLPDFPNGEIRGQLVPHP